MVIELETREQIGNNCLWKPILYWEQAAETKTLNGKPFLGMFLRGLVRMNRFKRPLMFSISFESFAEQLPGMMPLFHQTHVISKMNIIRHY